jgi:hypothetical protein
VTDALLTASARRPLFAAAALLGYALLVTATHDHVQDVAYFLQRTFGAEVWRPAVAALGALALLAAAWAAQRRIARSAVRGAAAAAWWGTSLLLVAAFFTLLATNMEAIHFVQYAIPALPLYALLRRFDATLLAVTVIGALDETWQYAVLHGSWSIQWDANDIVLNALGGALGCAWILVFARCGRAPAPPRGNFAATLAAALVFGAGSLALRAAGLLSLYPEEGDAPLLLSRAPRPEDRWEVPDWGRGHYVIHPGAALVVCLLVAAGFAWIDRRARWRPADETVAA